MTPSSQRRPQVHTAADLPACCKSGLLQLPRPDEALFEVVGGRDEHTQWDLGLDEWHVTLTVGWNDDHTDNVDNADQGDKDEAVVENGQRAGAHPLTGPVARHAGLVDPTPAQISDVLAAHGITTGDDHYVKAGSATVVTARLGSTLNDSAGRRALRSPYDVWWSADAMSGDLSELVSPMVDLRDGEGGWHPSLFEAWEEADMSEAVILLRSVWVTPVLRGHLLGAWVASQCIALFDHGRSVVAALAAPIHRGDAIPGFTDSHGDLSPAERKHWNAAQRRLASHWQRHLGLDPLEHSPSVVVWASAYNNPRLDETLGLWR